MATEKLYCPVCGTPMNHHADKLLYASDAADPAGEIVQELHRCPACGAGASRQATLTGVT
jgi:ribosomal protein S27AE